MLTTKVMLVMRSCVPGSTYSLLSDWSGQRRAPHGMASSKAPCRRIVSALPGCFLAGCFLGLIKAS